MESNFEQPQRNKEILVPGLLERLSTVDRIEQMRAIANGVQALISEAEKPLDFDEVIFAVADRLGISPGQVHYGINYALRKDQVSLSADGKLGRPKG